MLLFTLLHFKVLNALIYIYRHSLMKLQIRHFWYRYPLDAYAVPYTIFALNSQILKILI